MVFRAEPFTAADFEADEPDLAAVLDAADAALFDVAEATVFALRAVTRRDVAARPPAPCLAGALDARALDFEALVLTDEVFTELFRTEALEIVFALLAGALDATAFKVDALAAFEGVVFDVALAALVLGGMVGTLPG